MIIITIVNRNIYLVDFSQRCEWLRKVKNVLNLIWYRCNEYKTRIFYILRRIYRNGRRSTQKRKRGKNGLWTMEKVWKRNNILYYVDVSVASLCMEFNMQCFSLNPNNLRMNSILSLPSCLYRWRSFAILYDNNDRNSFDIRLWSNRIS